MNWFTGFVLYALIWWTVLFAVLPFGTRPVADASATPGGWRGAPAHPRIWTKVIATTLIATVLWVIAYVLITGPWISFRSGWLALPDH